jgi:GTP-binding protein Era
VTSIRLLRTPPRRVKVPSKVEKRLDIAIIGRPNVGKSVLLNTLIKEKLAATSRKENTTRLEILGIYNHGNTQLAFYDTPGFVKAKGEGSHALRSISADTSSKADVVLVVVDATQPFTNSYQDIFAEMVRTALRKAKKELILVLNKVDLVNPKTNLLITTRQLVSLINGIKLGPEKAHLAALDTTTFMISALQNDGVIDIKNYLISIADHKPWVIKDNSLTNLSIEERVEQIVLESLLDSTHEEIPYIADIECTMVENMSDSRMRVEVDIYVDTPGQQRIVVGQQGRTLVKIRQATVAMLEDILKKQVILYLWVKMRQPDDTEV